jgi:hypothetical protein
MEENKKEIDIDEEIEKKYFQMRNSFDKLINNVSALSDLLDLEMPNTVEEALTRISAKEKSAPKTIEVIFEF